jgi:beta-glucosidase
MKFLKVPLFSVLFILLLNFKSYGQVPVYLDKEKPVEVRVLDLLSRMTLEEKIGQLNMPTSGGPVRGNEDRLEGAYQFTLGQREKNVGPGGGFFDFMNRYGAEGTRYQAELNNRLQKLAVEQTRLKIPLLMTEEGTHGLMGAGATIFPEGLAIGSAWNMKLVEDIYTAAAREARSVGIHQLFTLVIEPNRDPRMGRNAEGYSEDTYMCSRIAEAIVKGTQGDDLSRPDKVVAGLCHFPGQSEPTSGLERGSMEISERKLREVFLPPWIAGIKKSGGLGVMATYPAIDGIPAHASDKLLTGILRGELGFQGLVLSEGDGLETLEYERYAANQKEAGAVAINAGVDVSITYEEGYLTVMHENVTEGKVNMAAIDNAVKRVLRLKYRLGLFDNPYVDPAKAVAIVHNPEHRELALKAAREGIVLLKNEKELLPLRKDIRSIAVIGPNANHDRNQLGDYIPNQIPADHEIVTILEGIRNKVSPKTRISYVQGCNVLGSNVNEIDKAVKAAKNSDVAIVVVGENERKAPDNQGTNGETKDVTSLDLTGMQEDLVKAVYATGTPVIVILVNGRPLSIRWIAEKIPAILEPWWPGEQGGNAVADVLFGDYNPGGRLPITVPRNVGQLPMYYNISPGIAYDREEHGYVDVKASPLYEFGYGLSYTTFEYKDLFITPERIEKNGDVHVSLSVTNTGKRAGSEVVQLYIKDVLSSVTRPAKELKGFEKIELEPSETKKVEFVLTPEQLSFIDKDLHRIVEPGKFLVMVGSSSENIRLKGEFEVNK